MALTKEIIGAVERGRDKMKKIEAEEIPLKYRKESAWVIAVSDIIDRTALAIRDELDK